MSKHEVIVNTSLCIGCGLCEKDCVAGYIKVAGGKATAGTMGCIACGHCEAVCPRNAVTLTGFEDETENMEQVRLEPQTLLNAIKTRRSIRVFKDANVEANIIDDIIEAGRLAPTGGNSQNTAYIILQEQINEAEAIAVNMFRTVTKPAMAFLKNMKIDDHFFFKKAPLVIVITGSSINASLAAQNMAFMAEAHGLGVLYSGFFTICANKSRKLRKLLQLEPKEKVITTLVIGYPGVKYYRSVRREKAKVRKL